MITAEQVKQQTQENAAIALKNRLFVPGWCMNSVLHDIKDGVLAAKVVLHFEENIPVAVALTITEEDYIDYQTMVFVRKKNRNQGLGSKLIAELNPDKASCVGKGSEGSINFWVKNGLKNIAR